MIQVRIIWLAENKKSNGNTINVLLILLYDLAFDFKENIS
jgi:hypothetical protein